MKPAIYLSFAQTPTTWALPEFLAVRVKGNPQDVADALRRIVAAADPDQPIAAVRTMDEILDLDVADRHQQMVLLGAFAGLALLLASIGLYGVLSYVVLQRSRELGLRMALGATAGSVMRIVVARGLALTGAGLAIGLGLAWALTRTLQNLLYGVAAGDPATFGAVVALLARHRARRLLRAGAARVASRSDRGAPGGLSSAVVVPPSGGPGSVRLKPDTTCDGCQTTSDTCKSLVRSCGPGARPAPCASAAAAARTPARGTPRT